MKSPCREDREGNNGDQQRFAFLAELFQADQS
jgi:hypothetical protein